MKITEVGAWDSGDKTFITGIKSGRQADSNQPIAPYFSNCWIHIWIVGYRRLVINCIGNTCNNYFNRRQPYTIIQS
jgi:hypothetical protein